MSMDQSEILIHELEPTAAPAGCPPGVGQGVVPHDLVPWDAADADPRTLDRGGR